MQNLGADRWPTGLPTDFYASPGLPTALAIADMNGDGRGDLVVVCREADRLRILGPAGRCHGEIPRLAACALGPAAGL